MKSYDTNGDGKVTKEEFMEHMPSSWSQDAREKYWKVFETYDANNDGNLQIEEVTQYLCDLYM